MFENIEMKWQMLIEQALLGDLNDDFSVEFPSGVSQAQLIEAELNLGFQLPSELKSLLSEFDGVHQYAYPKGEKLQIGSWILDLSSIVDCRLSIGI